MLISAVMPTRGRREYAAMALKNFLSQTWPDKELVIADDVDSRSFEQPPEHANIKYILLDKKLNIAEKRNVVCKAADGEIIVHFDSDDWSAPGRMAAQVELMAADKKAVCGFRKMYFWDTVKKQAWIYNGASNYVLGTSLMFKRSWWAHNHWDARFKIGSDNIFTSQAWRAKQLTVLGLMDLMVSRNHGKNTNPRRYGVNWKKTGRESLPQEFFREETCPEIQVPDPVVIC